MRRSPPVPHRRRLSCTRPSMGLRNKPQGSQFPRGITLTSGNSSWAFFGRSPPPQCLNDTDNFAALFEPGVNEWLIHQVGHGGRGSNEDMGTRDQYTNELNGEFNEEGSYNFSVISSQRGKAGQRLTGGAIEGRRNSPYSAMTIPVLVQLFRRVFKNTVRWVRDNRVDGVWFSFRKPLKGVNVIDLVQVTRIYTLDRN